MLKIMGKVHKSRRINAKIQDKGYLETREGPDFQMFSKS